MCRPGGGVYGRSGWSAAHGVEGVDAVEDMDLVAAAAERLAQAIDVGGVAAEAVRPKNVVIMQNFMGDLHVAASHPGCCRLRSIDHESVLDRASGPSTRLHNACDAGRPEPPRRRCM